MCRDWFARSLDDLMDSGNATDIAIADRYLTVS